MRFMLTQNHDHVGLITAWLAGSMHCGCAFCSQTQTALDMDDSDHNAIQNASAQINVSDTNTFE